MKVIVKNWLEDSKREKLRLEFSLKKHQIEPKEVGLFEKKPSYPRVDFREEGGRGGGGRSFVRRGRGYLGGDKKSNDGGF